MEIPLTRAEIHKAVDWLMDSDTLKRAVGDFLGQSLWVLRVRDNAAQVKFASAVIRFLDAGQEGGAA